MKTYVMLSGVLMCVCVSACGGRVANPVMQTTSYDAKLTCSHYNGEYANNTKRLTELLGERKDKVRDNFGMLLASPLFLDLSGTQKKEATAINDRNTHLISLMKTKDCAFIPVNNTDEIPS